MRASSPGGPADCNDCENAARTPRHPDLALLDAATAGDRALATSLRCDVAEGWAVFPQSAQRTRDAQDGEHVDDDAGAVWRWRLDRPLATSSGDR